MAGTKEIRWKIDGIYTAETMPLARLADYLKELAVVLGDDKHIHLMKVDTSSTVPVFRVDHDAFDRVKRRAVGVQRGMAPRNALQSYRKINSMLIEDKATAGLYDGPAEIIPFPGHRKEDAVIGGIVKQGTIDGRLDKVGGAREWVTIQLQANVGDEPVTGCYARRRLAKEMGHHLFSPVRLYGRGRWGRGKDGRWTVEKFYVDDFEPLDDVNLVDAVTSLRQIKGDWKTDPIAAIQSLRDDDVETA